VERRLMPIHDGPGLPDPTVPMIPAAPHSADFLGNPFASERPKLHPAVVEALRFFEYRHLPEELQTISAPFYILAYDMARQLDGPQLTNGLQRLLEAKDCMVRAALPRN
jgi:hypothetical protein